MRKLRLSDLIGKLQEEEVFTSNDWNQLRIFPNYKVSSNHRISNILTDQRLLKAVRNTSAPPDVPLVGCDLLMGQPPPLNEEESTLPRNTRVELARLRAERSLLLEKYKAKVENRPVESCIKCNDDVGDLKHFLKCYPVKLLPMSKLWKDPVAAATALGLAVTPFDPGGDADP
uniref:Uncharacterized protein n=1 Tax=Caenorhabditis japonica TaxID=281687 RepID=A0A8R1IPJ0_CAEJA